MRYLIPNIAIGTALIVLAGSLPGVVAAAEDTAAYEMVVATDHAQGNEVVDGAYERAIAKLSRQANRFPNRDPFDTATNLCVAHTMIGQYVQAESYCDKALTVATEAAVTGPKQRPHRHGLSLFPVKPRTANDDLAQAYSNRGVLRAISGNAVGAEDDFLQAIALEEADSAAATRNLASLHQIEDALMAGKPD